MIWVNLTMHSGTTIGRKRSQRGFGNGNNYTYYMTVRAAITGVRIAFLVKVTSTNYSEEPLLLLHCFRLCT